MANRNLQGLQLTKTERYIVVSLSYIFVAPIFYTGGKRVLSWILTTFFEARRQIREERRAEQRGQGTAG